MGEPITFVTFGPLATSAFYLAHVSQCFLDKKLKLRRQITFVFLDGSVQVLTFIQIISQTSAHYIPRPLQASIDMLIHEQKRLHSKPELSSLTAAQWLAGSRLSGAPRPGQCLCCHGLSPRGLDNSHHPVLQPLPSDGGRQGRRQEVAHCEAGQHQAWPPGDHCPS